MFDNSAATSPSRIRGAISIRREARRHTLSAESSAGATRRTAASLHGLTIALALLASVIFVLTDADGERSSASLWIQISVECAATLGFAWLVRRRTAVMNEVPMIIPMLLIIVVASLLWEPFQRWLLLCGRPFEMMVMHSQRNLMLAAAVFGCWASYQRLSILIGVALAILCATITREYRIQFLIAFYGCAAVSWMIAAYWDTLRSRLINGETRRIPLRWLIIGPSIPMLLLLASATGGQSVITAMRGFLPGSGGDGDSDPFSRSGVNDGDNLVAGTKNIKSFGPIEDAPFAEDDKPCLYDVINDSFNEPVRKIKDQDRSIALPPDLMAEINDRLAKSEQAGREFSTLRMSARPDQKKIRDLESHALLYVAGRVPLHLRMETYDVFDGVDWIAETLTGEAPALAIVPAYGRPWLRVPCGSRGLGLHAGAETHAIKVINFRSNVIPTPLDLRGLHIDKANQTEIFGWHSDTILKMNRESMPELTPIHLMSECMDHSRLPDHRELTFLTMSDRRRTQLPNVEQLAAVRRLAEQWTQGIPAGYRKIEAVCRQLRTNYTLDRSAHVPEDCTFPVGHFLFESKRGPDYQFATAATLMLRSLGFSTRLVSGFYVSPERYDARKRHTPVHSSDVHFWCEVFVGAGTWVTLDPSPGFEILSPPPGLMKRAMLLVGAAARWIVSNWLIALLLFTAATTVFVRRRRLLDQWNSFLWRIAPSKMPRARVLQTARLLDHRMRLAGLSRPSAITLTKWLRQHPELHSASQAVREFLSLTDWANYGSDQASQGVSATTIETCCQRIQQDLTLSEFQRVALDRRGVRPRIQQIPLSTEVAFS
jgi:hypothetical protein